MITSQQITKCDFRAVSLSTINRKCDRYNNCYYNLNINEFNKIYLYCIINEFKIVFFKLIMMDMKIFN